jgi:hypothetical protein
MALGDSIRSLRIPHNARLVIARLPVTLENGKCCPIVVRSQYFRSTLSNKLLTRLALDGIEPEICCRVLSRLPCTDALAIIRSREFVSCVRSA